MMISIPPKYAVLQVIGYIKGKSAIHLARVYGERKRNFVGQHFWARGYFASNVGRDEAAIREYIKNQEQEDKRLDQLNLWRNTWGRVSDPDGGRQSKHPLRERLQRSHPDTAFRHRRNHQQINFPCRIPPFAGQPEKRRIQGP